MVRKEYFLCCILVAFGSKQVLEFSLLFFFFFLSENYWYLHLRELVLKVRSGVLVFGVFIEIASLCSTSAYRGLNVSVVMEEMSRAGCQSSCGWFSALSLLPVLGQALLLLSPGRDSSATAGVRCQAPPVLCSCWTGGGGRLILTNYILDI